MKYAYAPLGLLALLLVFFLVFKQDQTESKNFDVVKTAQNNTAVLPPPPGISENVLTSEKVLLPLPGSAPTTDVNHTISLSEIRRGCFSQDCIPSVDDPAFISVSAARNILSEESIGIALDVEDENRFYPFPMLETHELVNDWIGNTPVLVSYCPLCGTGIVFRREIDGVVQEFGVSGMLWQSNLLMYNRAAEIEQRNLWSQVLGQAVVGERAGMKLEIIPSDIQKFSNWAQSHPDGSVLSTGVPRDPYGGDYFRVARSFEPDFDEESSIISPTTYVYGIEINGNYKAYLRDELEAGTMIDTVSGTDVEIHKDQDGKVVFSVNQKPIPDIEGFWFSWVAAHPDTEVWNN